MEGKKSLAAAFGVGIGPVIMETTFDEELEFSEVHG